MLCEVTMRNEAARKVLERWNEEDCDSATECSVCACGFALGECGYVGCRIRGSGGR